MMILMAVAMPSWKYVMQNEREQELYFRGNAIATAIERYQKKNGNAAPTTLEMLVKGKFLRKEYADPMTKDGKWRLVRPGEVMGGAHRGRAWGPAPRADRRAHGPPGHRHRDRAVRRGGEPQQGRSLRMMNGAETYDEWLFIAGKPRVLGKPQVPIPGAGPSGMPGQPAGPPGGADPGKK